MNITDNNNNSVLSTFDDDDNDFSNKLAIIQGSIYIPIFCAGIANNLLTIFIMIFNRDMHTVTNCYLLNLAISDTLPLIVSLPFEITVIFFSVKVHSHDLYFRHSFYPSNFPGNNLVVNFEVFLLKRLQMPRF